MINILLPMAGKSTFFDSDDYKFPKPFVEIGGRAMIEIVLDPFFDLEDKKFVFVVNQSDCDTYHLDRSLHLLCEDNCDIIRIRGETKGAACSCLMAIEHINNDDELIIANGDQVISNNINDVISFFRDRDVDAGMVTFESIHPKWSYVRLDSEGRVVETAEKKPISKNAIAGFYYFRHGKDFVRAAMRSIKKGAHVNGLYFIAPTLNEMILENKRIAIMPLDKGNYHSFYSPQKIVEYETQLKDANSGRA